MVGRKKSDCSIFSGWFTGLRAPLEERVEVPVEIKSTPSVSLVLTFSLVVTDLTHFAITGDSKPVGYRQSR